MFPADVIWPGNSSINYTAPGTTLANGGTSAIGFLTAAGQFSVLTGPADPSLSTDHIVDITGYCS